MSFTAWVDVAIGLVLVYIGASLFVTVINEYIAQISNMRGKQLRKSLHVLIKDEHIREKLRGIPSLRPFFLEDDPGRTGSYIDPNLFARFLIGTLAPGGNTTQEISNAVDNIADDGLKLQLQSILRTIDDKKENFATAVGRWIDSSLSMLGEDYRRNMKTIGFIVGLGVAVVFNLDTISLTTELYCNKEARDAASALALQLVEKTDSAALEECLDLPADKRRDEPKCASFTGLIETTLRRNESMGKLPVGWHSVINGSDEFSFVTWTSRAIGWLLTALALSLGAPFWFDLLNKLVNVRYGMRRPEIDDPKSKT